MKVLPVFQAKMFFWVLVHSALLSLPIEALDLPREVSGIKNSQTGETTEKAINCKLIVNNTNKRIIEGAIMVDFDFLNKDFSPFLSVWSEGQFMSRTHLRPKEMGNNMEYYFSISKELIESSYIEFYTNDEIIHIYLKTLTILTKRGESKL